MDWLVEHWQEIVAVIGAVVLAARVLLLAGKAVAKLTATTKDDEAVEKANAWVEEVVAVLKLLALHVESKENKP